MVYRHKYIYTAYLAREVELVWTGWGVYRKSLIATNALYHMTLALHIKIHGHYLIQRVPKGGHRFVCTPNINNVYRMLYVIQYHKQVT